jgi:aspartate kinase
MAKLLQQKPRLVMKFGGTSVADEARIGRAAEKVIREIQNGYNVAVVVSAKAGVTNALIEECIRDGLNDRDQEYSERVSQGENETSEILARMLNEMGYNARAWSGSAVPIICDNNYGRSRILSIPTENADEAFKNKQIMVVAGFQGISQEGKITTLGRGGSDTTAVALACAFGAVRCDIYTDVDGVYTADPRIVRNAHKISSADFGEMLEMAGMVPRYCILVVWSLP